MVKKVETEYSAKIAISKVFKNYIIPFSILGVSFIANSCDPTTAIITGVSLGTLTAMVQNYLKNFS